MCGRFTNRLTWREIVALYHLTAPASPERNLPARYNICPSTTIDAVIEHDGKRELVPMRWGLVPSWWKKTLKDLPSTFNARAETVSIKPMSRAAYKRSRYIIPASGYYEWKATPTGKQPYYITSSDGSPLSFAGLWDEWKNIETGEPVKSCTIIVTAANEFTLTLHDRMPVILDPAQFEPWLSGAASRSDLAPKRRQRSGKHLRHRLPHRRLRTRIGFEGFGERLRLGCIAHHPYRNRVEEIPKRIARPAVAQCDQRGIGGHPVQGAAQRTLKWWRKLGVGFRTNVLKYEGAYVIERHRLAVAHDNRHQVVL
jgi:putative SOS response-associated peptidase YedK